MGDFPVQSNDFTYTFQFTPATGTDNWELNFGYETGAASLFSSPRAQQTISGNSGISHSAALTNQYLALGNTGSGHVEIFTNAFLNNPTGTNTFIKSNRLTGSVASVTPSGFGFVLAASGGMVGVGAPDSYVGTTSGAGAVFLFQDYLTGGAGATGTANFSQLGGITGSELSGNYGYSLAFTQDNTDQIVGAGAPGESSSSGAVYFNESSSTNLLQKITPTDADVSSFGKAVTFAEAISLRWPVVGYDYGGTGKIKIYKETGVGARVFEEYQEFGVSGGHSGDLYGYSLDGYGASFVVGAPALSGGSGAVYIYSYDETLAQFIRSQTISPAALETNENFGKNIAFDGVNGIITSNKNSGQGYVYYNNGSSWSNVSTVSGDLTAVSGSFGGDISGSQCTLFEGNTLVVGSTEEEYSYYFTTGAESTTAYTGAALSGSGSKLFDGDGNFIYGYNFDTATTLSGSIFTGGYYTVFANGNLCNSKVSRKAGDGLTGALNSWTMAGTGTLSSYTLSIY